MPAQANAVQFIAFAAITLRQQITLLQTNLTVVQQLLHANLKVILCLPILVLHVL